MENPTQGFIEMNLVLQLVSEFRVKSKTLMSWSSRNKKKVFFVRFILSEGNFFNKCVLEHICFYI